jgi:REP element-mobilizing transposase RayT
MRASVAESVRESCEVNGWDRHALAMLSNHVHVVLTSPEAPERVMRHLKAYASRALNAADGSRRWWTRHGSTRWLNSDAALSGALEYVENQ